MNDELRESIVNLVNYNQKIHFLYPVMHLDFPLSVVAPNLGELAFGLSSVGFVQ
jgi:hypothetical protein